MAVFWPHSTLPEEGPYHPYRPSTGGDADAHPLPLPGMVSPAALPSSLLPSSLKEGLWATGGGGASRTPSPQQGAAGETPAPFSQEGGTFGEREGVGSGLWASDHV